MDFGCYRENCLHLRLSSGSVVHTHLHASFTSWQNNDRKQPATGLYTLCVGSVFWRSLPYAQRAVTQEILSNTELTRKRVF